MPEFEVVESAEDVRVVTHGHAAVDLAAGEEYAQPGELALRVWDGVRNATQYLPAPVLEQFFRAGLALALRVREPLRAEGEGEG